MPTQYPQFNQLINGTGEKIRDGHSLRFMQDGRPYSVDQYRGRAEDFQVRHALTQTQLDQLINHWNTEHSSEFVFVSDSTLLSYTVRYVGPPQATAITLDHYDVTTRLAQVGLDPVFP